MLKRDKKDEEAGSGTNPFHNLDKTTVLQEARIFNETPINARKSGHVLTKILYILNQGETLGRTEATEAFFAVTKLWQSKDATVRRLLYLAIKELCGMADDVIIVTSSLTKDMTGREDSYRASAIRALCKITDTTMLQAIDRYMKQAIVDKVPSVSSAALVSSLHLLRQSPDVVRRWVNEVQEAVSSDNPMVQLHALGVLYNIRKSDRLAVSKLVAKLSKSGMRSPYALCYLIRITYKMIEEDNAGPEHPNFPFLEACLRHKCELVIYEAAAAIVSLSALSAKDLSPAISVLQLFCSSPRPALRFAAVRTLNKVATRHPEAVTTCNVDLENLIGDQNRSVATLAITTLLKTGAEASVDRLMKQISTFVSEISDEFKIVVIQAIQSLCSRYPSKHAALMNFLLTMLRDEGGFEYKKAIVDTIITIIEENPDSKAVGLAHLCEFIEDCEHSILAIRILHLIGSEGPRSPRPAKYIRFIFNRVILENALVRAAAVTALAKFGAQCPELLPNIKVLLNRCLLDSDDEVRDRAAYYLTILEQNNPQLNSQFILNGLNVDIVGLERALQHYLADPVAQEKPFDMKTVPLATQPVAPEKRQLGSITTEPVASRKEEKPAASKQDVYAEQLSAVPALADLGPLFKSNEPIELTEAETEYGVQLIKHVFLEHVVLQFDVRNTLDDQVIENVTVHVDPGESFEVMLSVPAEQVPFSKPGTTYTLLKMLEGEDTGSLTATMKFTVKDCDPTTGEPDDDGYEDEYVLEDFEIGVCDNMQKALKTNFAAAWEEVGDQFQLEDTYALTTFTDIQSAVKQIVALLGMAVCERTERVAEGKSSHILLLSGVYRGGDPVLVRAKFALTTEDGTVTMNFGVRSSSEIVSQTVVEVVGG